MGKASDDAGSTTASNPGAGRFIKGRTRSAGRKKGTPNKRTLDLLPLLQARGIDPILKAIGILTAKPKKGKFSGGVYVEADNLTQADRLAGWLRLARFIYPERKAMEGILTSSTDGGSTVCRPLQLVIMDATTPAATG